MENLLELKCKNEWFNLIKTKEKTVEGRLKSDKFNNLKCDDIIKLSNDEVAGEFVFLKVLKVVEYKTFKEMLEIESLEKVLPTVDDINNGINVYRNFYTEEDELQKGVIGIHIKLI